MKDKIVIIGASGHGKVVADIAKLNGYQEIVFVDDDINKEKCGLYKVVGTSNDVSKYKERYDFFVAIGSNDIREKLTDKLNDLNIEPILLIHPSAVIDATVSISSGTVTVSYTHLLLSAVLVIVAIASTNGAFRSKKRGRN